MPRPQNPPLSINEAYELQPGDKNNPVWVNGLIGVVISITPKKAGAATIYNALLENVGGGRRLSAVYWDEPRFGVGDTIEIAGTGARRTEFQGEQSVSPSKNNTTHVVTSGGASKPPVGRRAPLDDERGGNPPPPAEKAPADGDRATTFHQKMKANAALYLQCLSYARKIQTTLKAGNFPEMSPDHFQACVSTLFIAGDRQGLGIMPPPFGEPAQSTPPPARRASAPAPTKPVEDEDVPF